MSDKEWKMILRIDHVSLAVKDFRKAAEFFCDILGAVPCAAATDDAMKYLWQIFALGDLSRLEIIAPTGDGSFLDQFLEERKGVHHITLQTEDLAQTMRFLEERGIPFFGHFEWPGGEWKEIFIHPRDAFGVLVQIAEFNADDFIAEKLKLAGGKKWSVKGHGDSADLVFTHPGGGTARVSMDKEEVQRLIDDLKDTLQALS
jgi:methylmalonyl-CoA/ethylmalonyl-CoA epimerase